MSPLLETKSLSKQFGGLPAVSELDLTVLEGGIHALIGPNGAGKSTTLNMLSGIIRPTAGTVALAGRRIDRLRASAIARIGIGRTFQVPRLFAGLTLIENVMVGSHCRRQSSLVATILGLSGARTQETAMIESAHEMLSLVGMSSEASRLGRSATFVQQRKVEIARALVLRPTLLLLDEPAAGLNAVEIGELAALLRMLRARGITILFIEHHMRLVMDLADCITVLDFGCKIAEGSPELVRKDPAVLAAYLGDEFSHAAL